MASRRGKRRSKSRRRGASNSTGRTIAVVIIAALMCGGMAAAAWWYNDQKVRTELDPLTLCPKATGPVAMQLILLDLTDPLSATQQKQLLEHLGAYIARAPIGSQFTLGQVSEDIGMWGATAPLCKPQNAGTADPFTQNAKLIDTRYEKDFLEPLTKSISELTHVNGAKQSPIMEALQALVATTPGFISFVGPRKVILVSDLLQNSSSMSFYRGDDWQSFSRSKDYQRLSSSLHDASVVIFQVPRPSEGVKDPAVLEDFWARYFDVQGAHLPKLVRLGDL